MTMLAQFAAAGGGALPAYIEDIFSTFLYTGNGSTQTITNGIDLAGEGGLVWTKGRSAVRSHKLVDTVRGAGYALYSNNTDPQTNDAYGVTGFNSNGYNLDLDGDYNGSGVNYVGWTFRKQPKFFDVVTYTTVSGEMTIPHNLGSVPGCWIIKATSATGLWGVFHRSIPGEFMRLNGTSAVESGWSAATSTDITISTGVYSPGTQIVIYLFAHDAGGFGLSGEDNVISCGSFTGNSTVTLGWEPQFVMYKATNTASDWYMFDTMRKMTTQSTTCANILRANTTGAESGSGDWASVTATGFINTPPEGAQNYIYIAIRRGPMKVPTDGTSVFAPIAQSPQSSGTLRTVGFPADLVIGAYRNAAVSKLANSRLTGFANTSGASQNTPGLFTNTTAAESLAYPLFYDVWNTTARDGDYIFMSNGINWMFGRAPGFFDEVCYTGTGVARTVAHNLAAVPELIITKGRSSARDWYTYNSTTGNDKFLLLSSTTGGISSAIWNNTSPTSTTFTLGASAANDNGGTYVAYLFATCAGVSKVGSYTGTATTQVINCGFTTGARFVLIKRTDDVGDWYVWDSARGIVAGNDPYLLWNNNNPEVTGTDYVDTSATGFELTSTAPAAINASGGSFIFLAIS